jgi:glycosyltransferase involved in cell wall biosynthesis
MKTILMVTAAPFLSAGNQSIRRTVSGLLDNNYRVELWTLGSNDKPIEHKNLIYKCFKKDKITNNIKMENTKSIINKECVHIKPEEIVDLNNDFKQWTKGFPVLIYYFIKIFIYTIKHQERLRDEINFIWGYERPGVIVSKLLSKTFVRKPFISSFQGTALNGFLHKYGKIGTFLKLPIDYIATFIKGNLVIMTDDGTKGDKVLHTLGHKTEHIVFVPNGIDKSELDSTILLDRTELGFEVDDIVCVLTARLERWKRVDRAIILMEALIRQSNEKYKLIIVGDGKERYCLEKLSKNKGLSKYIQFWGWQPYLKSLQLIKSSDMLWTFQDHSNLTNSVQDALAFNKVIVTVDDGSINNVVKEKSEVIMIPLNNFADEGVKQILKFNVASRKIKRIYSENIFQWEDRIKYITDRINKI